VSSEIYSKLKVLNEGKTLNKQAQASDTEEELKNDLLDVQIRKK